LTIHAIIPLYSFSNYGIYLSNKTKQKFYIFSGAGISEPSGVSTFTCSDGLWGKFDIDKVCNLNTWLDNYRIVHKFYNLRRQKLKGIKPNIAHELISKLQKKLGVENVINITTNTDGLFDLAGVKNTLYLHGKISNIKNMSTGKITNIGYGEFAHQATDVGAYKPDVVFLNEKAENYIALNNIIHGQNLINCVNHGDIFIFIGMSSNILPIESIVPTHKSVHTININTDKSTNELYPFDETYNECATKALPDVLCGYHL
jgi:NAD-dependent deacetylase